MAGTRTAAYAVDNTTATSMDTTYKLLATLNGDDATRASDFPGEVILGLAQVYLTSVATAVSITWYISEDAAGDKIVAGPVTSTFEGQTSGIKSIAESINQPWVVDVVAKNLYAWGKLDAGTATVGSVKLSFNTPANR